MSVLMDGIDHGGERIFTAVEKGRDLNFVCFSSSSSSSSIGKNSDDEGGETEVQSPYKGPLDMMDSLKEALPIRSGLSKFYKGKSKSFKNLPEAVSSSMKDLGRPENPYNRRRRNFFSRRIRSRGGISKKPSKSSFTHAVTAIKQIDGNSSSSGECSPPRQHQMNLPPLQPKQNKGTFGNYVPVVDSPRCFQTAADRNIHNIIC